jgi:hypothetical protein
MGDSILKEAIQGLVGGKVQESQGAKRRSHQSLFGKKQEGSKYRSIQVLSRKVVPKEVG